ncbi:MAG: hypothetical protein AB2A00_34170 [Myxococcota bacterium]
MLHPAAPRTRHLLASLLVGALLAGANCSCEEQLTSTTGTLRVTVVNAPSNAPAIQVTAQSETVKKDQTELTARPETVVVIEELEAGNWEVRVLARDDRGAPITAVWVSDVLIRSTETTEVRVDLAGGVPITAEVCDGLDNDSDGRVDEPLDMPICSECRDGFDRELTDDARCGEVDCDGLDRYELRGENTAVGTAQCIHIDFGDLTANRCVTRGECVGPNSELCTSSEVTLATAGVCHVLEGCETGNPVVVRMPDGTDCGGGNVCVSGECVPPPGCDPQAVALCHECVSDVEVVADDDARCGTIDCDGLDRHELRGQNTAEGESTCVLIDYADVTSNRCTDAGECVAPNSAVCTSPTENTVATAGLCRTISGCESGTPVVDVSPEGTPCGADKVCRSGNCETPVVADPVGCADGTREGFLSQSTYPAIAGCSGAWSVPGVTLSNPAPQCARAAGNSGSNVEGTGCASADLCAVGWHVCRGKAEVAANAPSGCNDAVPPGTPDKALFFAVSQNSTNNTTCDDSTNDNDVFGCGNLGVQLTAERNCGPLNRALASTQPNSCGYNEAEPNLGPWQCLGGADSHLHEGSLVTKNGCAGNSCSYSGSPVGSSDKGGVLCCRD